MIKALVIDDIFLNRLLIVDILEETGHECVGVSNGAEAIEYLKKEIFDIVFLDIEMPKMNGFETVDFIRKNLNNQNSNIPIIATTAHFGEDTLHNLRVKGFTDVIQKPYTKFKLLDVLKKYIDK